MKNSMGLVQDLLIWIEILNYLIGSSLLRYPVGLQKILQLLTSTDSDVQVHAVKVVANLAAEGVHSLPVI